MPDSGGTSLLKQSETTQNPYDTTHKAPGTDFVTRPPETTAPTATAPETRPPAVPLGIPLTPLDVDIAAFVPTAIRTYDNYVRFTVLTDGEISYIVNRKGAILYRADGNFHYCQTCDLFYESESDHTGFSIRQNYNNDHYYLLENQSGGHGAGVGYYVYDTGTGALYDFSAYENPFEMRPVAEDTYYPDDRLYPAIAMALPREIIESFDPVTFDHHILQGKYGLADKYGNIAVPFEYDSITRAEADHFLARKDGTYSFIFPDGRVYADTFPVAGRPFLGPDGSEAPLLAWVYDEAGGCRLITLK